MSSTVVGLVHNLTSDIFVYASTPETIGQVTVLP